MLHPVSDTFIKEIQKSFRDVKIGEPLERHTTFRLPTKAAVFVNTLSVEELISLLRFLHENKLKHILLGGGSNIIFANRFYDGVVIKINGELKKITRGMNNNITAGGGAMLPTVEAFATREGLSGFESLSGIPGSIGGALVINAGTKYGNISDLLSEVTILDEDLSIKKLPASSIEFSYRKSSLRGRIVLSATFVLKETKPSEILKKINIIMSERSKSQPKMPSAGCIFKNPSATSVSAGKLIESCGLKGYIRGGAMISEEHANFIVNKGDAATEDVLFLIELARRKVKENHGIDLETEVEIIK